MGKIILNQEEYEELRNYKTEKYEELEEEISKLETMLENDYIEKDYCNGFGIRIITKYFKKDKYIDKIEEEYEEKFEKWKNKEKSLYDKRKKEANIFFYFILILEAIFLPPLFAYVYSLFF